MGKLWLGQAMSKYGDIKGILCQLSGLSHDTDWDLPTLYKYTVRHLSKHLMREEAEQSISDAIMAKCLHLIELYNPREEPQHDH